MKQLFDRMVLAVGLLYGAAHGPWAFAQTIGPPGGSTVCGSNTQIQFNSSGSCGANANLTFNTTNKTLGIGLSSGIGNGIPFLSTLTASSDTFDFAATTHGIAFNQSSAGVVGFLSDNLTAIIINYTFRSGTLGWATGINSAPDTALARNAAGIVEVNNGTPGTFRDLTKRNDISSGYTMIGSSTAATLSAGEQGMTKITASGTAPGAGSAKFEWTAGTNAGSCKLISYAGTSTTPVTIVDNVGSGC